MYQSEPAFQPALHCNCILLVCIAMCVCVLCVCCIHTGHILKSGCFLLPHLCFKQPNDTQHNTAVLDGVTLQTKLNSNLVQEVI